MKKMRRSENSYAREFRLVDASTHGTVFKHV